MVSTDCKKILFTTKASLNKRRFTISQSKASISAQGFNDLDISLSRPIDPFDCFRDSTQLNLHHPLDDDADDRHDDADDHDRWCFGSPLLVGGL